jgi:hypothetical protein
VSLGSKRDGLVDQPLCFPGSRFASNGQSGGCKRSKPKDAMPDAGSVMQDQSSPGDLSVLGEFVVVNGVYVRVHREDKISAARGDRRFHPL